MLSSEMAMRNFLGTSSAKIFFRNDLSYRRLVSDDSEDVVADDFVDDLDDAASSGEPRRFGRGFERGRVEPAAE